MSWVRRPHPEDRIKNHRTEKLTQILCLAGRDMEPTGQRPLSKDYWGHNNDYEGLLILQLPI